MTQQTDAQRLDEQKRVERIRSMWLKDTRGWTHWSEAPIGNSYLDIQFLLAQLDAANQAIAGLHESLKEVARQRDKKDAEIERLREIAEAADAVTVDASPSNRRNVFEVNGPAFDHLSRTFVKTGWWIVVEGGDNA